MNKLGEIESAIECLSTEELAELAAWIEQIPARRPMKPPGDAWLERARGAAQPEVTTAGVLALTRGEE